MKMAVKVWTALTTLFALFNLSNAYVRCGSWECYGAGAYCCGDRCCYYIWGLWWFWMLWILIFTLCVSCGFWCRRRNRYRPEYIVVRQPETPVYGATVYSGNVPYGNGYAAGQPTTVYAAQMPHAPAVPPAYTDQKPPAYAQQAQNP